MFRDVALKKGHIKPITAANGSFIGPVRPPVPVVVNAPGMGTMVGSGRTAPQVPALRKQPTFFGRMGTGIKNLGRNIFSIPAIGGYYAGDKVGQALGIESELARMPLSIAGGVAASRALPMLAGLPATLSAGLLAGPAYLTIAGAKERERIKKMSPKERAQLFVDWKADKLVNVDALLSTSTVKMSDIYKGYGEKGESHITELVDDLNQVVQYGIGPGEFALSVLSQRIEGIGAASGEDEGKGDLIIDGSPVELKTTRKNAARFNDREVTVSDSYKSLVTAFFNKYKSKFEELEQQGLQVRVKSGMQQNHVMEFLKAVPEAEKEVAEIISNIFTNLNVSGGPIA